MPMPDAVLIDELNKLTDDATGNNSTFISNNSELLDRYDRNPYGDEQPELSKVISNDVMDIVESDMPSLVRIFLGSSDILKFESTTARKDEKEEADDKTKYINWQIRNQPWSYSVLSGFIKNAEIFQTSVLKYFIDEKTTVEEHKHEGLSDEELALVEEDLEKRYGTDAEIVREEQNDDGENTVVFKVERTTKKIAITNVPLENFRFTKNAENKNDADIVGDVSIMKRGEILAMGIDRKVVESLELHGDIQENTRMKDVRDKAEGGKEDDKIAVNWASEEVEVQDLYPLIDYDDDGILERRHIMISGEVVIINEVFNHVPYAMMSSVLMPHKAIGKSRAEITAPTAKSKTAILRGINDNISAVTNPRLAINENVNMDDLLVLRKNGIIQNKKDTLPSQNIFPVEVPYIGDKALQVIQYWDQARSQTTGSLLASQGLDADELGKETATRFNGIRDASEGKIELVARTMVETGFRELFEGVEWLDRNFQNEETEIQVLGHELRVKPTDWKYEHSVVSKVGLGAGDDTQTTQTMTALWVLHQQLQQMQSPMTDEVKRYNILKNMVNASGEPDVSEFFNNPERPEQMVTAQNEILTNLVQQLQQQLQQLQNPLAEAETIKQQGNLIKAQSDAQLQIAKLQEDQRQFNVETAQNQDQFQKNLAAQLSELQLKFQTNVPGAQL